MRRHPAYKKKPSEEIQEKIESLRREIERLDPEDREEREEMWGKEREITLLLESIV